jgi:hypothetical protein
MYNNDIVDRVDSFKYLGVTFDPQLSWSNHINQISSIVSKRIGVIRRVKYCLPNFTLKLLANALVMPHLDYCSPVWSNCNMEHSNTLQILHNRLARIILSADIRTPISDLMNSLNWAKLDERWMNQHLIMVFKCLKGSAPQYLSSQFVFTSNIHSKGTRSQSFNNLHVPPWKIAAGKKTFHYRASKLWNGLPVTIRSNYDSMSLNVFKNNISL